MSLLRLASCTAAGTTLKPLIELCMDTECYESQLTESITPLPSSTYSSVPQEDGHEHNVDNAPQVFELAAHGGHGVRWKLVFEYATTDKDTGRKKLTVWGHRGVVFAGLALACSFGLTLWTDYEAAYKQKGVEEEAARDRENAAEYQQKLEISLTDIKNLMEAISTAPLSQENRVTIRKTIVNLAGIEDYKKYFPDLYDRLTKATSFAETSSAINEGLDRAVSMRISDREECADVPRSSNGPMVGGFPGGHFMISGSAVITFMITPDSVIFGFSDASDLNSLGNGNYKFLFADGSQSSELQCTQRRRGLSCEDKTSDAGARGVYGDLQKICLRNKNRH